MKILRNYDYWKIPVNVMTQKEFDDHLKWIVQAAFREGVLWEKCHCGSIEDGIKSAIRNILELQT